MTPNPSNPFLCGPVDDFTWFNWRVIAAVREVNGVGVRITRGVRMVGNLPDGGLVTVGTTLEYIVDQVGSDRIPVNGTIRVVHNPCFRTQLASAEITYYGVDDNGNDVSVMGSVGL